MVRCTKLYKIHCLMEAIFSYYTELDKELKSALGTFSDIVSWIVTFQNMWIIIFSKNLVGQAVGSVSNFIPAWRFCILSCRCRETCNFQNIILVLWQVQVSQLPLENKNKGSSGLWEEVFCAELRNARMTTG